MTSPVPAAPDFVPVPVPDAGAPAAGPAGAPAQVLPPEAHFLLIRFGSLGDLVKCTALPRLIKRAYPAGRITFVTSEAYLELIRDNPHVERAIGFERAGGLGGLRALGRELARDTVHLVVDVHKSLRSRALVRMLRAPHVAYSKRTWQRFLLVQWGLNTYAPPRNKEQDFLAGLLPYGVTDDGLGTELHLGRVAGDAALRRRLGAELAQLAAWREAGTPVLGVAPVAAWELKRWPLRHVREFMARFVAELGGRLVVFGGPGDADAQALAEELGPRALSLVGRTSHLESAWFASLLDLVLANDTGMSHLAEAAGTDALVLFGPTSRELGYFPSRPGSRVLERDLPCRPCTRMGEGRCTHPLPRACLELITPQQVLAAVRDYLAAHGTRPARAGGARPC